MRSAAATTVPLSVYDPVLCSTPGMPLPSFVSGLIGMYSVTFCRNSVALEMPLPLCGHTPRGSSKGRSDSQYGGGGQRRGWVGGILDYGMGLLSM